jgi:hypothetical protein
MMIFDLDYSPRHCWGPNNEGRYRLADSGLFDDNAYCDSYDKHPLRAGKTEFLRFIHNFPVEGVFTSDLKLGPDIRHDGLEIYCENYGGRIKAFLDTKYGIATIEVIDDSLDWAVLVALNATKQEYMQPA